MAADPVVAGHVLVATQWRAVETDERHIDALAQLVPSLGAGPPHRDRRPGRDRPRRAAGGARSRPGKRWSRSGTATSARRPGPRAAAAPGTPAGGRPGV